MLYDIFSKLLKTRTRSYIPNFFIIFLITFSLFSCGKNEKPISFYHWKTNYTHSPKTDDILKKAKSEKLYLRFFDLGYNSIENRPFPTATLQMSETDSINVSQIIPVIYITNEVFEKETNPSQLKYIADETLKKILRLKNKYFDEGMDFPEIQIDCDWTVGTKDAYFAFLEELQKSEVLGQFGRNRSESPIKFSATIRLHQVKFPEKTGIPPVDSGMIMFYNVGDLGSMDETNSILNVEKTESYLDRLHEYPLDFNVALPVFEWGVLYRDNKLAGILNDLSADQLSENFMTSNEKNWFVAKADSYIGGYFIYKGDKLRMEKFSFSDFKKLQKMILKAAGRDYSVVLYHLNSPILQNIDIDELLETVR